MPVIVGLELSDVIVRRAREIAARTSRSVESVLTDWLERGAVNDEFALMAASKEYAAITPYGNEDAAQVLWDYLLAHQMEPDTLEAP
jgi:hypothetical protein